MQRNDIILPNAVSHLKETMMRVECPINRPEPDGYLTKFMKMVEGSQTFQGIALRGSLQGKLKRGKDVSECLQSEINKAVNLTTEGLRERFGILLSTEIENQGSKVTNYGPKEVVRDMHVFNVNSWPTHPSDLLDYGRVEIERLIEWFQPILHRAGCNITAIQEQWVSMKIQFDGQFRKMDYPSLWETFVTKCPYKEDFKDVSHLVEMVLVLPISAAQCERAVSAQNQIKGSTRATLSV